MPRLLIVLVPLIAIAFAASACDGDGASTSPTPATPAPTPPTPAPVPSPTVSRVTKVDDVDEFLEQFADERIIQRLCTLDAASGEVNCGEDGLYKPKPPPAEDADCDLLLVDEEPIAVVCTVQDPLTTTYYEVP